jgi:hypothetical protein
VRCQNYSCSSLGQVIHLELCDVSKLLGSSPSWVLSLAYYRICCCCCFGSRVVEVIGFPNSRSFGIETWSLLLPISRSSPCSFSIVDSTKPLWKYLQLDRYFTHKNSHFPILIMFSDWMKHHINVLAPLVTYWVLG